MGRSGSMFVNGVRVKAGPPRVGAAQGGSVADPFDIDALSRGGILATARWAAAPADFRPGDPAFDRRPAAERAALEADAGRAIFTAECAIRPGGHALARYLGRLSSVER